MIVKGILLFLCASLCIANNWNPYCRCRNVHEQMIFCEQKPGIETAFEYNIKNLFSESFNSVLLL